MNASSRLARRCLGALILASLAALPARADRDEDLQDERYHRLVAFGSRVGGPPRHRGWMGLSFPDSEPKVQFYRLDDADRVEQTLKALRGDHQSKEDPQGRSLMGSGLPLHELKLERVIPGPMPGTALAIFSRRFTGRAVLFDQPLLPRDERTEVGWSPYREQPAYGKDPFMALCRDDSAPREDKRITVGKRSVVDHFQTAIQEASKPFAANLAPMDILALVTPEPAKYSPFQPAASMRWRALRFNHGGKSRVFFAHSFELGFTSKRPLFEFEVVSVTAREGGGFNAVYKSKPATLEGESEPPVIVIGGNVKAGDKFVALTGARDSSRLSDLEIADALMTLALRKNPEVTPENLHAFVSWAPERAGFASEGRLTAGHEEKVKKTAANILDED